MSSTDPEQPPPPETPAADGAENTVPTIRRRFLGKHIVLCVSGSIAAYKSVLLLRSLQREGARVSIVLSRSATQFIGAATFAGLTGEAPFMDMFSAGQGGELHVDLARRADLIVMAPATADLLARLASGRADDLVTALSLCARCPLLIAPAMHPRMWDHPATRRNVELLKGDAKAAFVGPQHGEVASGEVGVGRMAEPELIVEAVAARLTVPTLSRCHIVVTAGPTSEDIDPVRSLTNRSSGKMGFAIAARAALHGARVTLIAGPVNLPTPPGVTRIDVRSALAMRSALWQALHPDLSAADALIMAAAIADYRPAETHAAKLKRGKDPLNLELLPNPDLLAEIGEARRLHRPLLVGFALETETGARLIERAREKLVRKKVDVVVANSAEESIGLDHVQAVLVSAKGSEEIARMPKEDAADRILDWVNLRLRENGR